MRYRFLIMMAVTAIIGFLAFLPGTEINKFSYTELGTVSGAFMGIGILLTLAGFALIARGPTKDKTFYENFVLAGLIVAAFGLGIMPFSHQKFLVIPVIFATAFALALIVPNVRARKHDGLQGLPIFLAAISGPAAMWALAAGWGFFASGLLLVLGFGVATYMTRLQPVTLAATQAA